MTHSQSLEPLPEDWHTALAVVAHPDDLEYGCASAVARWTSQGKRVIYLLVTRGEAGIDAISPDEAGPRRETEERQSARVVGVETVDFLDYRDGVIEYGLPLRRDIARAVRRYRPDVLITTNQYLTWPGNILNMADHRWVAQAVLDAARDAGNRWIFPDLLTEGLEPWSGVRMVCLDDAEHATHAVDVTAHLAQGIASLEQHHTYLTHLTDHMEPDRFLREYTAAVGQRFGCDYAVGFEVIWL